MPRIRLLGASRRVREKGPAPVRSVTHTPSSAGPSVRPSGQGWPKSLAKPTGVPSSRAAETSFASVRSVMARPFPFAHTSTAKRPLTSVAVDTAACPPVRAATRRASALAPPTWPDSRGTANRPASSTLTTAGSVNLSFTWGAMARTAMPAAPTKISPPALPHCAAVQASREGTGSAPTSAAKRAGADRVPPRAAARVFPRAAPLRVKAITATVICWPPGTRG